MATGLCVGKKPWSKTRDILMMRVAKPRETKSINAVGRLGAHKRVDIIPIGKFKLCGYSERIKKIVARTKTGKKKKTNHDRRPLVRVHARVARFALARETRGRVRRRAGRTCRAGRLVKGGQRNQGKKWNKPKTLDKSKRPATL
jgi:hypothetical protein